MIYAIGDIHGQLKMLRAALTEVQRRLTGADTVVFLGDYIDRGENSALVIEAVLIFRAMKANIIFLRGNHEEMMLDAFEGSGFNLWMENGGRQTIASYNLLSYGGPAEIVERDWREAIPESHWHFLRETRLEWQSERFHFVHAGLVPPSQRENWGQLRSAYLVPAEPRLWIRRDFIDSEEDFGKIVVFGHTVQKTHLPLIMGNKVGLDTGAFFGGKLTVGVFDDAAAEVSFFQVSQSLEVTSLPALISYQQGKPL